MDAAIAAEPWCHRPPACPYPDAGTPANPLTGDHVVAMARGGPRLPPAALVVCKRCNSEKGARPGW